MLKKLRQKLAAILDPVRGSDDGPRTETVFDKYTVVTTPIDMGKHYGAHTSVDIFQAVPMPDGLTQKVQIGHYDRNYSTLFRTFCPFVQDGKDYALYSYSYGHTAVMELPSCKMVCEEVRSPTVQGFCPTDFLVPDGYNGQFGFVAGCIWGDDTSWKIEYLDLSQISKGTITREHKFGYIALPRHHDLKDVICMHKGHIPRRLVTIEFEPASVGFWQPIKDNEYKDLVLWPTIPDHRSEIQFRLDLIVEKMFDLDKDYSGLDYEDMVKTYWPATKALIEEAY